MRYSKFILKRDLTFRHLTSSFPPCACTRAGRSHRPHGSTATPARGGDRGCSSSRGPRGTPHTHPDTPNPAPVSCKSGTSSETRSSFHLHIGRHLLRAEPRAAGWVGRWRSSPCRLRGWSPTAPTTVVVQQRDRQTPRRIHTRDVRVLCQSHQITLVSKAASVLINSFMEGNLSPRGHLFDCYYYLLGDGAAFFPTLT